MKKYKIWTEIMLSITLVMMVFCITIDVSATVVVPEDTSNYYYVGNNINLDAFTMDDVLSVENYNQYFDTLSGDDKNNIFNRFVLGSNNYGQRIVNDIVYNDYVVNNGNTINSCYFSSIQIDGDTIPIDKCYKMINLMGNYYQMNRTVLFSLFYSPTGDEIVVSNDGIYSSAPFYYSFQNFTFGYVTDNNINHFEYYVAGGNHGIQAQYNSTDNVYQYVFNNDFQGVVYCDMVYLFTSNSLTDINTNIKSYNAYINKTSNLAVDRRTMNFIDIVTPSGGNLGTLSGSFYHLFGGTSLSNSKLLTMYQLNDYADSNRYNVYINYDYTFDVSGVYNGISLDYHSDYYSLNDVYDSYLIGSSNYLAIDMNKVFEKMTLSYSDNSGAIDSIARIKSSYDGSRPLYIPVDPIDCFDILSQAGLSTYTTYDVSRTEVLREEYGNNILNFSGQFLDDLRSWIFGKPYETQVSTSSGIRNATTLCKLSITTFLSFGDEVSGTATYTYDFLTGTWSSQGSMDYDGDQTFTDYQYKNPNNDVNGYNNGIVPSDYYSTGGYINTTGGNGYGGNASIGNITIGAADTIVDISTDEWLTHSPNYNELITTIKTGLIGVGENSESVTALLTETYAVFPVPIWSYLTLAIATISALAVIRYIRRG